MTEQAVHRRIAIGPLPAWLEALAALGACACLGALVATNPRYAVMALVASALLALIPLLARPHAFESAAGLMLLTLPLYSAFVLDLGITVRLAYLFGGAALLVGARQRRLQIHAVREVWTLLVLFLLAVVGSIVLNPVVPQVDPLTASGLRGLPGLRPLLQAGQLVFMVGLMWVTVGYCRSRDRLITASTLIVAGGLLAIAYAYYAFGAMFAHVRFIDINNAMNSDFSFGYKNQNNSYFGGTIPRPRSTFAEPQNFGNFLLLVLPLMFARRARGSTRVDRLFWTVVTGATLLLFLFAVNSRGAIYGAVFAGASLVVFARDGHALARATGRAAAWAAGIAVASAIFVQASYVGGVAAFAEYVLYRLTSAVATTSRVEGDWHTVWTVFRAHPLFGVGFGNLTYYVGQVEGVSLKGVTDAGGLYQRLLSETGVVGLTLYLSFVSAVLFRLLRVGRRSSDPLYAGYARALFFAITADAIQRVATVGIATDAHLWVALGLAIGLAQLAAAERSAPRGAYATASNTFKVSSPADRQE